MVVFDSCKVGRTVNFGLNSGSSSDHGPLVPQELAVSVSEDFIEYLTEGAVAIEVFGHRQAESGRNPTLWDLGIIQAKTRTLRDR